MSLGQKTTIRTREEIEAAICGFTVADYARLESAARYFGRGSSVDTGDLVQEALVRALDDRRSCPADVPIMRFLIGVIRSLASGEREKDALRHPADASEAVGEDGDVLEIQDLGPDAEAILIRDEEDARIRAAFFTLFDDDPVAQDILVGIMEGLTAEELRELTGLDVTAYNTKRRLMRRRIDKKFPAGGNHDK